MVFPVCCAVPWPLLHRALTSIPAIHPPSQQPGLSSPLLLLLISSTPPSPLSTLPSPFSVSTCPHCLLFVFHPLSQYSCILFHYFYSHLLMLPILFPLLYLHLGRTIFLRLWHQQGMTVGKLLSTSSTSFLSAFVNPSWSFPSLLVSSLATHLNLFDTLMSSVFLYSSDFHPSILHPFFLLHYLSRSSSSSLCLIHLYVADLLLPPLDCVSIFSSWQHCGSILALF